MDTTIATFVANGATLTLGTDIFIDEDAAGTRNCVLIKTMQATTPYVGIKMFDVTIIICNLVLDTARTLAETITDLFNAQRGIIGGSWGTVGNVVNRYEGTDTVRRTVYTVACKIGKEE